jgi:RimJ/RimL family protein N-acetyltransferase
MSEIKAAIPKIIETERLILRFPTPVDVPELNAAVCETFDDLSQWVEWAKQKPSIETTAGIIDRMLASLPSGRDYPYYAFVKETGEFVAGMHLFAGDLAVPMYELGYWCRARFQGRGYISEAVRALTRFGIETLLANRLQIQCDINHSRSRRVAERSGYRLEATLENDKLTQDSRLRTTAIYVFLPRDMNMPVEIYTDARVAEFLLSNAVSAADYEAARGEVRAMGLGPDSIQHIKPVA